MMSCPTASHRATWRLPPQTSSKQARFISGWMCIEGRVHIRMKTLARHLLSFPARLMDGGCDGVKSDGTTTDPLLTLWCVTLWTQRSPELRSRGGRTGGTHCPADGSFHYIQPAWRAGRNQRSVRALVDSNLYIIWEVPTSVGSMPKL